MRLTPRCTLIITLSLALAACPPDDTATTSASADTTSGTGIDDATESGTTTTSPTTMPSPDDPLTSTSTTSTTGGLDTTTEPTTGEPVEGCARFIELHMNAPVGERHILIDACNCLRTTHLELRLTAFGVGVDAEYDLGTGNTCNVFGGADSVASTMGPAGRVIDLLPEVDAVPAYMAELRVDGVGVEAVRVPAILKDPAWPVAPPTPIHRDAEDEGWSVVPEHIPGCP